MTVSIALAGKPNTGKSTFFKAATLADAEIANYPFTTIKANIGITHVRVICPCDELAVKCENCIKGARFVPVELVDVAGLVPEAYKGRGLGNAFLDDLRQSEVIINVIDISGGTDIEGKPIGVGMHDPLDDVELLDKELTMWLYGIIQRNWARLARTTQLEEKIEHLLAIQLAGTNVNEHQIKNSIIKLGLLDKPPSKWTEAEIRNLSYEIRKISKPMVVAANKKDIAPVQNLERLVLLKNRVITTSAEAELALRLAHKNRLIDYIPGDKHFKVIGAVSDQQKKGLEKILTLIAEEGTGVQTCINSAVFNVLDYIVVYPVEDENKLTDSNGNVLPDAFLMKRGQTVKDLAYKVHTDIGMGFLYAIDARNKKRLGEHHVLSDGDVIKIASTAKHK
ncbi:MAG TPA: redox-regulated ATPase YchF [Candidatus Acidoferrales bacterium]|nr:redox-regulated ATPase YchF [Candidatus Acidoferrales bacterium]